MADIESMAKFEDCHRSSLDSDRGPEISTKVVAMMVPSKQGMIDWMVSSSSIIPSNDISPLNFRSVSHSCRYVLFSLIKYQLVLLGWMGTPSMSVTVWPCHFLYHRAAVC